MSTKTKIDEALHLARMYLHGGSDAIADGEMPSPEHVADVLSRAFLAVHEQNERLRTENDNLHKDLAGMLAPDRARMRGAFREALATWKRRADELGDGPDQARIAELRNKFGL